MGCVIVICNSYESQKWRIYLLSYKLTETTKTKKHTKDKPVKQKKYISQVDPSKDQILSKSKENLGYYKFLKKSMIHQISRTYEK